ncbi:exonuclease domain-containing protein [Granulosicoccaceae sp. 1_MG-2023]|nr:exonuclease domain-containing protein [Granulosicoccaceae sp. 1_MG-2023]
MKDLQHILAERQRRQRLKQAPEGALARFLASPLPAREMRLRDAQLVATDFETGGLDPARDALLSMGCVPLENAGIRLGGAWHTLIAPGGDIPAGSVRFHKITDSEAQGGLGIKAAVDTLLDKLSGRIMLAHHARTETGFLFTQCERIYGVRPVLAVLDTLSICSNAPPDHPLRKVENRRLFTLRDAFKLPQYPAHHALYDALSTAELLLAHCSYLNKSMDTTLKTLQIKYIS